MSIKGYVIQNDEGAFLAKLYFWISKDNPEEAWVHKKSSLTKIQKMSTSWMSKPIKKIPAEYAKKSGTVILGEAEPF